MPTPEKRPLKVFLCHAHADRDAVRTLYNRLIKDGVDAWLDKEKLLAGADWEMEIRKAVRESDVVVVCHSTQFNQKGFRQKEVKIALEEADLLPKGEIFIIPARLEVCDVLDDLKRFHWVDLFETDGYEGLMRALRTRADKIDVQLIRQLDSSPELETKRLESIAIHYELIGDLWNARKTWYDIKHKDPSFPRVDIKLNELEYELRPKPTIIRTRSWISTVAVLVLLLLVSIPVINGVRTALPASSETPFVTKTSQNSTPMYNVTETFQPNPITTYTPTLLPTEITDAKGVSMVLVPEGKFTMGINLYETIALCKYYYWSSEICDQKSSTYADQTPPHQVDLDAYYIDKYEVTNSQYESCVSGGVCSLPERISSGSRDIYYGNPTYGNYPVLVNWGQATTFCDWRDARLPTEAEWEKAARGTDERVFPWGDAINCENANFSNCGGSMNTLPVGSYEKGKSPYGIYDMAGNFSELVSDWYDHDYYQQSPLDNPTGPSTGEFHIIRGGGNGNFGYILTSVYRQVGDVAGFRCAKDASAIQLIETSEIPAGGFDLISIDEVAYRGGTASAQIQTQPGTGCALGFILPSGILSQAGGLGPRTADENGYCSWTWEIAGNVNPGWGSIYIEAGGDSETYPIEIK